MNIILMEQIVYHIFSNLNVVSSNFIDAAKTKSLMDKDFLTKKSLTFVSESGDEISNKIWGCQLTVDSKQLKMLLGNCSQDEIPEYCLIVKLQDAPAYGIYLIEGDGSIDNESLIAMSVNNKDWEVCSAYFQATFLAAMEQVKQIGLSWSKCVDCDENYNLMLSFIKYHDLFYGEKDEG